MKTNMCIFIAAILLFVSFTGYTFNAPEMNQLKESENSTVNGKLVRVQVHGQGLENNLFGDADTRNVSIYLPPGYDESANKDYPVVYLLSWEKGTDKDWFCKWGDKCLEKTLNYSIRSGKTKPMIVVSADGNNSLNGCWYTNSPVAGNWEDFIAKDVVNYVDENFRTIPVAAARGIAGHSMGGYGALKLATKHADVFGAVYALNPYVDFAYLIDNSYIWSSCVKTALEADEVSTGNCVADALIGMSAAFAPDETNPPFYGCLFENKEGQKNNEIREKWLAQDPMQMINCNQDNLKSLRSITIDCSYSDALIKLSENYSKALNEIGITNTFRFYMGKDTSQVIQRVQEFLLPEFSEKLVQSFIQITNYRHSFTPSDKLKVKLFGKGTSLHRSQRH